MTETIEFPQEYNDPFKKYIPILTAICCAISVVLFIGINLEDAPNWETYKKWGAPNAPDIFNGSYWGLITSNFVHVEIWHIFFNVYWIWILGKKIEFESNKLYYAILIVTSALASSVIQIAFSTTTGIGLSGIAYSFFGFIYVKSRLTEEYKNYIDNRTNILFMVWLVACIILTQTGTLHIANGGHIGGLLWGAAFAYLSKFNALKQWILGLTLLVTMVSLMFWSPFSISWLSHQAYELHSHEKYDEAAIVYEKILSVDSKNEFAKENLKVIKLYHLSEQAILLEKTRQYGKAKLIYEQMLRIDSTNQWAKENIELLPLKK